MGVVVSPGTGHVNMDPVGFWIYGSQFLNAANAVVPPSRGFSPVRYYLTCHSIELSLKAFLLRQCVSVADLKHLGHNLTKILERANGLGLRKVARVTPPQERELHLANGYYNAKAFEYFSFRRLAQRYAGLPKPAVLGHLATQLVDQLERYCLSDPEDGSVS